MVPAYPCPVADAVRDAFQAVPAWTTHLQTNASLKVLLDEVFGTAGLNAWARPAGVSAVSKALVSNDSLKLPFSLLLQMTTFSTHWPRGRVMVIPSRATPLEHACPKLTPLLCYWNPQPAS